MHITHCKSYVQLSNLAATMVLDELSKKQDLLICTATGHSPTGLYQQLGAQALKNGALFKSIRIIKLDEWGGIPMDDDITCESYLKKNLLTPLKVDTDRYISFNTNAENISIECERIQKTLKEKGPIDICILGLGANGHIGFNEPASFLQPDCHQAVLSPQSLSHQMIESAQNKPTYGLTLGIKNILDSKKIILLITGANKHQVTKQLLSKKVTTQLPASLLWLHPYVECLIDETI